MALKHAKPTRPVSQTAQEREHVVKQALKLLNRLKGTVPLPCTPMELYAPLVPEVVRGHWLEESQRKEARQLDNLRLSMMWGTVVHVCLDDYATWQGGLKGTGVFERVFWMDMPFEVPVSDAMTHPFLLTKDHCWYKEIIEWHEQATRVDAMIDDVSNMIARFLMYADTGPKVRATWPDLLRFLRFKGPTMGHVSKEYVRNIILQTAPFRTPSALKKATDALTTATLLPDVPKLDAWVSFKLVTP